MIELVLASLTPVSAAMALALEAFRTLLPSYGLSIILLSVLVRIVLLPISCWATRIEGEEAAVQQAMRPAIDDAKRRFRGRQRFEKIDEIYSLHRYHPINALRSLSALALQIPFLLAALFLLTSYPAIRGESFGAIADLARPDALLSIADSSINVLPVCLTLVALVEAFIRPASDTRTRIKFAIIAFVVLVLIYDFPAAVSLYWLSSNAFSLTSQVIRRVRV